MSLPLYEGHTREEIVNSLRERYPETEVEEALDEVQMLVDNEELLRRIPFTRTISWISKAPDGCEGSVPALHCMTATLPVSIALPRRASTMGEGLLVSL